MSHSSVVLASEEENIDSMDVFPSNRWAVTDGYSDVSVTNGLLNLTDIGDGSTDLFFMIRDIRDLDGNIEVRFKVNSNESTAGSSDVFLIQLFSAAGDCYFWLDGIDSTAIRARIRLEDVDGNLDSFSLTGDEVPIIDEWYRLRIDYNILKSVLRYRLYFDNGSKLFDYNSYDVTNDDLIIFSSTSLGLRIQAHSNTVGILRTDLVDYVKAPFKEREWSLDNAGVGFLADAWNGAHAEDNIDEGSIWSLTIPFLDSVAGQLTGDCLDSTALAAGEGMDIYFRIWTVDYDDGTLFEAVEVHLRMEEQIAPIVAFGVQCVVEMDSVQLMSQTQAIDDGSIPTIDFSFSTTEDRSRIIGHVKFTPSIASPLFYFEQMFSVDLSDVSVDYSSEFILSTHYTMDFDGDTEFSGSLKGFRVLERGIWSDWAMAIAKEAEAAPGATIDFFATIFRWLGNLIGSIFAVVGDLITGAITAMQGVLDVAIGAVQTAVEAVTTAIGLLAEQIITVLQDALDDIIGVLLTLASDLADLLFAVIDLLLDLILDIVDELWAILVGMIFFVWDALNLPDILSVFDLLLVGFGQAIAGFGQFVTDINALIGNIFTISVTGGLFVFFFLPITISPTIGQWIEKVFQFLAFDITFGVSPWGIIPRIPAGAVWLAIVIGSGVLSGSVLGGFL